MASRRFLVALVLVIATCLAAALPARAHDTGSLHLHAFGEVGARLLDGELFLALRPGLIVEAERILLIIAPPLHLGLDPEGRLRLRPEDFDSLGDYGRILYLMDISCRRDRWRLRAGALSHERLGHGTVVSDYVAALDPDSPHTALRLDLRSGSVHLEAIAGSLLTPMLYAARLSAAPVSVMGGEGRAAEAWRMGALFAIDPTAPVGPATGVVSGRGLDAPTSPVAFAAIDTSLVVYRDHRLAIEPYADGVITVAGPRLGRGAVHLGVLSEFGGEDGWRLSIRAEARRMGSYYLAEHFDTFYSLERWGYPFGGSMPKATVEPVSGAWGGRGEITLVQSELGLVGFSAGGRPGGPMNAGARLVLSERGGFSGAAFVAIRGMGLNDDEVFARGLGLAELRYHFTEAVYLMARGGRSFRVDLESARHRPVWDAAIAVGATL